MVNKSWLMKLLVGVLMIIGSHLGNGRSIFSIHTLTAFILFIIAYMIMSKPFDQYYNK